MPPLDLYRRSETTLKPSWFRLFHQQIFQIYFRRAAINIIKLEYACNYKLKIAEKCLPNFK